MLAGRANNVAARSTDRTRARSVSSRAQIGGSKFEAAHRASWRVGESARGFERDVRLKKVSIPHLRYEWTYPGRMCRRRRCRPADR
jgi:hypothetical protein